MTDQKLNAQENVVLNKFIESFSDLEIKGIHHPDISPIALNLGPLELRWYSLAYLLGIILGWVYINYINRKHGNNYINKLALDALPLWMVLSIIFGGRIGYVLFYNLPYYMNNLQDIYKIWQGGMSFHGGLTGVIIGTVLFSRYYKLQFFKVTDMLALATPIGLFLGRLANFINKELIGKQTSESWGIIYPGEKFARHPSQLYEATMEGLLLFIILFVGLKFFRLLDRKGAISGLFLMFYGIFRFIAEIFREPDRQVGYVVEHISMGQILCIPMILAGIVILLLSKRANEITS